jgi:hypothetical protein
MQTAGCAETGNAATSGCDLALALPVVHRICQRQQTDAGSISGTIVAVKRSDCGANGARRIG